MAASTSGASSVTVDEGSFTPRVAAHRRRRPDPLVETYLRQIRKAPLLTREEESALAHRLRKSRQVFRRWVLANDWVASQACELLDRTRTDSIRFDRVIEINVRDKSKKKQIMTTLEQNVPQAIRLLKLNRRDEKMAASAADDVVRNRLSTRIRTRRRQVVALIESSGLRMQFVELWWETWKRETSLLDPRRQRIERVYQSFLAAKTQLANHNVRLVVSIAKRYQHSGLSLLDLIQEGNVGLMSAVEKFDACRGLRFSTYATCWIAQTIRKAMIDKTRSVRLPLAAADRVEKATQVVVAQSQKMGRTLSREELEVAAKFRGEESRWVTVASQPTISLDQQIGSSDKVALHESLIQVREELPFEQARQSEVRGIVESILSQWEPRERDIIRLRYGLGSSKTLTLEEVGRKLRLSRERVRQLEKMSLLRLKEQLAFVHSEAV